MGRKDPKELRDAIVNCLRFPLYVMDYFVAGYLIRSSDNAAAAPRRWREGTDGAEGSLKYK